MKPLNKQLDMIISFIYSTACCKCVRMVIAFRIWNLQVALHRCCCLSNNIFKIIVTHSTHKNHKTLQYLLKFTLVNSSYTHTCSHTYSHNNNNKNINERDLNLWRTRVYYLYVCVWTDISRFYVFILKNTFLRLICLKGITKIKKQQQQKSITK